jgi:hypothetical protein
LGYFNRQPRTVIFVVCASAAELNAELAKESEKGSLVPKSAFAGDTGAKSTDLRDAA